MFKRILSGVVFAVAVVPGPGPTVAGVVPAPAPVEAGPLSVLGEGENSDRKVTKPGSQSLRVEVKGRFLALDLVRSGSAGFAVLTTPQRSVISSLPDIALSEFQALAARESGCSTTGEVQVMGSTRGTVALATGLSCS